jgi:hypothetical protein
MEVLGMLACPRAPQARPWATLVHPQAEMILVIFKPTWMLQTQSWVGQAGKIIRYNYILLYVMIIVNRYIVSLIFNKILFYLNCQCTFIICDWIYYVLLMWIVF